MSTPVNASGRKRLRAAKACGTCNERRVRCDASTVGIPCTRCRQGGKTTCQLITSKRGTYPRKKSAPSNGVETTVLAVASSDGAAQTRQCIQSQREIPAGTSGPETRRIYDEADHLVADRAATDTRLTSDSSRSTDQSLTRATEPAVIPQGQESAITPASTHSSDSIVNDSSPTGRSGTPQATWTSMFEHLLSGGRDHDKDVLDKCSITYLGETFPLALVLDDFRDGPLTRVHHNGPFVAPEAAAERIADGSPLHPAHLATEDLQYARAKGAFTPPTPASLEILIEAFMDRVYPLYPIIDPHEFMTQHKSNKLPWILLHSVCYIATTFCSDATVVAAGFTDRKSARISFQTKAKTLFDIGYHSEKVVLLQSALMLSFWGGRPDSYWNFYSWLSTAVTIAETLGIHRSFGRANIEYRDRSLLKRLWWTLVLRDSTCSAFIGRPFRIDMTQCDTELLNSQDFPPQHAKKPGPDHLCERICALYHIHAARLSLIIRSICAARFKTAATYFAMPDKLCERLAAWYNDLPQELRWSPSSNTNNILSATLSIHHDHYIILSYLGESARPGSSNQGALPTTAITAAETSHAAAQRILQLTSVIARKEGLLRLPHEAFHGLFMAEAVCFTQTRHPNQLVSQLGHASLSNCQLLFHSIREAFDASPWVIQLFDTLSSSEMTRKRTENPATESDAAIEALLGSFGHSRSLETQVPQEHDLWMNNPMLSTIFDMPFMDDNDLQDALNMPLYEDTNQSTVDGCPVMTCADNATTAP